jgi:hypothetical protein
MDIVFCPPSCVKIELFHHSGHDTESRAYGRNTPCQISGVWLNGFWIPAPVPDSDPGFAGMTALMYFHGKLSPEYLAALHNQCVYGYMKAVGIFRFNSVPNPLSIALFNLI